MKTTIQKLMSVLLLSLLLAAPVINAQATGNEPGDSIPETSSFEVGMFIQGEWIVNLTLAIHQPKRVIITMRGEKNTVLYRQYVKRSTTSYRQKFNFNEAEPGVYQFEISDGNQIIVRRVEVVRKPTIEPQRYISYDPNL